MASFYRFIFSLNKEKHNLNKNIKDTNEKSMYSKKSVNHIIYRTC